MSPFKCIKNGEQHNNETFLGILVFLFRKLQSWWRRRDNIAEEIDNLPQWEHDYDLVETSQQGLFYEYLEMGM